MKKKTPEMADPLGEHLHERLNESIRPICLAEPAAAKAGVTNPDRPGVVDCTPQ
jgi:hypothetical protein